MVWSVSKHEADLILMMTAQESDMHDLFIGSTTTAVIKRSNLPVMTIIPGADSIDKLPASDLKTILDPIRMLGK